MPASFRAKVACFGLMLLAAAACTRHGAKPGYGGAVPNIPGSSRAGTGGARANGSTSNAGASAGTSTVDARVSDRADAGPMRDDDAGAPGDDDAGEPTPPRVPAPTPSGCINNVSPGRHQFPCDGISHDVNLPVACTSRQCGLVIDVHGGTMTGKMEDNNTQLAALGERYGYVVIQPNAAGGLFDASTDDDKVYAFAKTAIAVFHLDPKRVHMTGFSEGGYMTWRFICHRPEFLASAAPAAAAGQANLSDEVDCSFTGSDRPAQELDILYMHGKQDALVDYANAVAKADAVRAAFAMSAPERIAGDTSYERLRSATPSGKVFEFIDHDYLSDSFFPLPPPFGVALEGHCYPGSMDREPTELGQLLAFGCVPPTSFTWGEEVMAFFRKHEPR